MNCLPCTVVLPALLVALTATPNRVVAADVAVPPTPDNIAAAPVPAPQPVPPTPTPRLRQAQPAQALLQNRAAVTSTEARFVLPMKTRPTWSWHQPNTQGMYSFVIEVATTSHVYQFGYNLDTPAEAAPGSGNLADLLKVGAKDVLRGMTANAMEVIPEAKVEVEADGDNVVVCVRDAATLKMLFTEKPQEATAIVRIPGEAISFEKLLIRYPESTAAAPASPQPLKPAPSFVHAPVAVAPATNAPMPAMATSPPATVTEPHQLVPARIGEDGQLVLRHHPKRFAPVVFAVTLLEKTVGDSTAETALFAHPFKPIAMVVSETLNFGDVRWFDRGGKPVPAEAVRQRLAAWCPVLVLPTTKEACFPAPAGETLLECFRPELLMAVVPEAVHSAARQAESPANGPVPAAPVPTRAHADEKGCIRFRLCRLHDEKIYPAAPPPGREITKQENAITVPQVMLANEELAVEPKFVQFFGSDGQPVEAAAAARQLAKEATVLVSRDGEKVNAFYLKTVQPGSLLCVLPFDLYGGFDMYRPMFFDPTIPPPRPASPRAIPAPASEEAAPLPKAPSASPPPHPPSTIPAPSTPERSDVPPSPAPAPPAPQRAASSTGAHHFHEFSGL